MLPSWIRSDDSWLEMETENGEARKHVRFGGIKALEGTAEN